MTITKINEMDVVTKVVRIMNQEFVLVSFKAQNDGQREAFGNTIYGLIPYDCIDEHGYLTKVLNGGDMQIDGNPENCIRNMTFYLKCKQWKADHPNATEMEFVMAMANVEW